MVCDKRMVFVFQGREEFFDCSGYVKCNFLFSETLDLRTWTEE